MANPPIPAVTKRAPTIDFIDQKLPKYHPAFASRAVEYDPMSVQYVPVGQALGAKMSYSHVGTGASSDVVPRPEWSDLDAMNYWNSIFPESMSRFKSTPGPKNQSDYDIRDKLDWHSVYDTLQSARNKYRSGGGRVGWIRDVRRKAADKIAPGAEAARIASKVAPQDNIATPVIGAVEVLLDAVKTSAAVRNEVLVAFDGLVPIFSDVELFLSTFQNDANIRNASIDLIAATLLAIERTIGFFISKVMSRVGKALFSGVDYQRKLLDSLEMIHTKSRDLMQEALKSHIFDFRMYSQETRKLYEQLDSKVESLVHGVSSLTDGYNGMKQLLEDHLLQKERELEAMRQENTYLRVENGILRSTSPLQPTMWLPPQKTVKDPVLDWYISQSTLRQMIGAFDVDIADINFIMDKKEQLFPKDRSRAEQIINSPLFRDWIVSTSSAKLLIHWDNHLPRKVAEVSPLSVFCMMMAQSMRAKDRFLSALWFCGQHIDANGPGARSAARLMLSSLIDQLLRQFQFDTRPLHKEVDPQGLQEGDLEVEIKLLVFLVRQLPPAMTVFFIIDGAVLFERDEFEVEASQVFLSLIYLVRDETVGASVKLLFTSTPGTDILRMAFEVENLILDVGNLPQFGVASEERMARELEGELDEDRY